MSGPGHADRFASLLNAAAVVALGTGVSFALATLTNLFSPKVLDRDDYGLWRELVLYAGYAGVAHFGFVDGVLMRLAGRDLGEVAQEVRNHALYLLLQQSVLAALAGVVTLIFVPATLTPHAMLLIAAVVTTNISSLAQYTLQALKMFGWAAASGVMFQLVLCVGLLAGFSFSLSAAAAMMIFVFALACSLLIALFPLRTVLFSGDLSARSAFDEGRSLTRLGGPILLGNLASVVFFGVDRLVAAGAYPPATFALYAFPTAVIASLYMLVGAATNAAFPFLASTSRERLDEVFDQARRATVVIWAAAAVAYFPLVLYVRAVLPEYADSLPILRILVLSIGTGAIIRSAHFNYFRLGETTHRYAITTLAALAAFTTLLIWATAARAGLEAYAWAAVFSSASWFLMNEYALREHDRRAVSARLSAALTLIGAWFWFCSSLGSPFFGALLYSIPVTAWVVMQLRGPLRSLSDARKRSRGDR